MALSYSLDEFDELYSAQPTASADSFSAYNEDGITEQVKPTIKDDFAKRVDAGADAINSNQNFLSKSVQLVGQGAGFVGDLVARGIGAVTPDFIESGIGKGVSKIAETEPVQDALGSYKSWASQHPEAAKNLEASINIATLIPAAKGTVGAINAAGKAAQVAGKLTTGAGRLTKATGSGVYKSAFTPTVHEAEKILNYKAKTPFGQRVSNIVNGVDDNAPITRAQTAFDTPKMIGRRTDIGVQSKRAADNLWQNDISPAVKNSNAVLTKEEMFTPIKMRIARTQEPGRKKSLQQAFEAIQEDYADVDGFNLEQAQKIKSEIDNFTPDKIFKGQPIANEYRTLSNDIANAVRAKTYNSLKDVNIRRKYVDWANLHELQKMGVKAISEGGTKGGFGGFWTTVYDAATVPVKTAGGKTLYRVGNTIEFVGENGIKKFGKFLETKGYTVSKTGLMLSAPTATSNTKR